MFNISYIKVKNKIINSYNNIECIMQHDNNSQDKIKKILLELNKVKQYNSVYLDLSYLKLSYIAVNYQCFDIAIDSLNKVMKKGDKNIKNIAKIRLAKIYIDQQKFTQALDILNSIDNKDFFIYKNLILGDIYFLLTQHKLAKIFWFEAQQDAILINNSEILSIILNRLNLINKIQVNKNVN